jgi:hypothetical protein
MIAGMKISGPNPPTAAPLPEPWAQADEMNKSIVFLPVEPSQRHQSGGVKL